MGTINYLQAIKPDTAYIRKIINASLLYDWAIRIEYQEANSASTRWTLWEQTFFALRSADPVLESLVACYKNNLNQTIRINAEKFRPQCQLLLTVYNPELVQSENRGKTRHVQTWLQREPATPTGQAPQTVKPF